MIVKNWAFYCVTSLIFFMGGCALFGSDVTYTKIDEDGNVIGKQNPLEEIPAQKLLMKGMDDYRVGKYFTAVEAFEEIFDRYPFSKEAVLAQLKAADCSYHMKRYEEAEILYENFENNHPTNESIPYVLYQKGMCNYRQIDRIDRDPNVAEKAIRHFRRLITAFPNSPYTLDAKKKSDIATEFLANHEFAVAQFYVRTEKYTQAKARLRYLLAAYPNADITPKGEELLNRLESGDQPKKPFLSFLPNFFKRDLESTKNDDEPEAASAPSPHRD